MELVRDDTPVETPRFSHTFIGPAVYTEQHHFQKMTFSDIDKNKATSRLPPTTAGSRWCSITSRRRGFRSRARSATSTSQKIDPTLYRVGVQQPVQTIAPGQSVDVSGASVRRSGRRAHARRHRAGSRTGEGLRLGDDHRQAAVLAAREDPQLCRQLGLVDRAAHAADQGRVLPAVGGELQVDGAHEGDHAAHAAIARTLQGRSAEDELRR